MEMKVEAPLNEGVSQINDSKEMVVNGSANIYPHLIPQTGDMFVADIGEGRAGVFEITNVARKSLFKETVHTVEYKMLGYAGPERVNDLNAKTVQRYVFVRDFLYLGKNPHIVEEKWQQITDLQSLFHELVNLYFSDFYSHRFSTLLVPDQENLTYDPYMVEFVRDILDVGVDPRLKELRVLNISANQLARNATTVLDAIKKLSYSVLPSVTYTVQLQGMSFFRSMPQYNGIFHSGITDIVFPAEGRTDVDAYYEGNRGVPEAAGRLVRSNARVRDLRRLIQKKDVGTFDILGNKPNWLPDIHRVADDPFYIFTERFYFSRDGQRSSVIEVETMKLLQGKPLDLDAVTRLAQRAQYWDNLERFYLIPIVFVLLKVAYRMEG